MKYNKYNEIKKVIRIESQELFYSGMIVDVYVFEIKIPCYRGQKERERPRVWMFPLSYWEFPRRRVNRSLWEGGHFHKNEGKALKQRRAGASRRVHFGKDSQVYLELIVRTRYLKNNFHARLRVKCPNHDIYSVEINLQKKKKTSCQRQTIIRFLDEDGRAI